MGNFHIPEDAVETSDVALEDDGLDTPDWNMLRAAYRAGLSVRSPTAVIFATKHAMTGEEYAAFRRDWMRANPGRIGRIFAGAMVLALLAMPASAAPPPVGSDDWNTMHPYKEWVTTQHDGLGHWCCDIGDGRPVHAQIRGDAWWVLIDPKQWADQSGPAAGPQPGPLVAGWLQVPDEKITRNSNPTGSPIVWLFQGRVQCFAPPDGA